MPMGRPKVELTLSETEQLQLASMARSRSIPAALVTRARIVLAAAAGEPNSEIARRLQLTRATVGKWRSRFLGQRINGLYDEVRPGKPRTIDDERVAELIYKTLQPSLPTVPRIGAYAQLLRRRQSLRPPSIDTSSCWASSRTAAKASNCRPTRSSSRNCATWSACT